MGGLLGKGKIKEMMFAHSCKRILTYDDRV